MAYQCDSFQICYCSLLLTRPGGWVGISDSLSGYFISDLVLVNSTDKTGGTYLMAYQCDSFQICYCSLLLTRPGGWVGISDSLSGYFISNLVLVTSTDRTGGTYLMAYQCDSFQFAIVHFC